MEITTKTKPQEILKLFRECKTTESVNLKLPNNNYIYLIGGILNKLENGIHYFAINNKWVKA